jgi:TetR/AcrR family transcriptional regulator, transcriptional repressor for nem operon
MARPRNRIRTNDPAGMRSRVLDAAASAFQSAGYAATSIHDLIRLTGVTGGALHHHFPSKKSLALAVIDERVAAEVASTWIEQVQSAPSAAEGIVLVFDAVANVLDAQGAISGCPVGNLASELSSADEDLRSAIGQRYAEWRDAIVAKIEADLANGRADYARDDALGFASNVIALFTGALTIGKAEQSTDALRAAARQLRNWMAADL